MTSPPNGQLLEVQLPSAIERRQRSSINTTKPEGQRIYTNISANPSSIGSAKKQYEVGQILEFAEAIDSTLQPMLVSGTFEIRHDTNVLDLESLGVSQDNITAISNAADSSFISLNNELNLVKQERSNTETAITENKKNQNETKKAIEALTQLISFDSSLQSVLDSLKVKFDELTSRADSLVQHANELADDAVELENRIIAIAQMVR